MTRTTTETAPYPVLSPTTPPPPIVSCHFLSHPEFSVLLLNAQAVTLIHFELQRILGTLPFCRAGIVAEEHATPAAQTSRLYSHSTVLCSF